MSTHLFDLGPAGNPANPSGHYVDAYYEVTTSGQNVTLDVWIYYNCVSGGSVSMGGWTASDTDTSTHPRCYITASGGTTFSLAAAGVITSNGYYARDGIYLSGNTYELIFHHQWTYTATSNHTLNFTIRERIVPRDPTHYNGLGNTITGTAAVNVSITSPTPPPSTTYTIYYYDSDGTYLGQGTTNSSGQHTTWSARTKTGYDFLGWWNGTKILEPSHLYTFGSDYSLYAYWANKEYTINYYRNFTSTDTTVVTSTAIHGTDYSLITLSESGYVRAGYKFLGWNTKRDGSGTTYQPGYTISSITGNKTYFAIWQPYCVRIFNGEDFEDKYIPYIYTTYDGTTKWWPHQPYIYNGSTWEPYGG